MVLAVAGAGCTGSAAPGSDGAQMRSSSPRGDRGAPIEPREGGPEELSRLAKTSAWFRAACSLPEARLKRIERGIFPGRGPDLVLAPRAPNYVATFGTTSHSGPWDYLQKVPLVFYGPGYIKSQGPLRLDREVTVADLAPTMAELLDVPWPNNRWGRPVTEALVPAAERPAPPRLIVTVVWDGGGWNVLDRWPDSWPFLRQVMDRGTSVEGAIVGSSPSVTPAIHTNIGTGTLPDQHGIADIPIRAEGAVADSFRDTSGELMKVPTLADLYDPMTANKAKVALLATKSWHLGLIGRGSAWNPGAPPGGSSPSGDSGDSGDKDIAVIAEGPGEGIFTNPDLYRLPEYLRHVPGLSQDVHTTDIGDGLLDSAWMGHDILEDPAQLHFTPAWVLYQTRLLESLVDHEGMGDDKVSDLLFTNYKSIDEVGHRYNMVNPEMKAIVGYSDRGLEELTGWLDDEVGRGRWVLAFTADHGQAPAAEVVGAWPIHIVTLVDGLAEQFGVEAGDLIEAQRPTGLWLDRSLLGANGITLEEMADWLTDYTLEQNIPEGTTPPEQYESRLREKIFEAVFPARWLPDILECAAEGAR